MSMVRLDTIRHVTLEGLSDLDWSGNLKIELKIFLLSIVFFFPNRKQAMSKGDFFLSKLISDLKELIVFIA